MFPLHPHVREHRATLAARFRDASPFPHVVIDDFLAPAHCARLVEEFPPFELGCALDENGALGRKATVERVRELGRAFVALDDLLRSRELLELLGEITGIPNLLYDPDYVGGGTHENRAGQELDPHVDFNRHPTRRWHRRLNLLLYLNAEWDAAWGGNLELHRDPRRPPEENPVERVLPLFNRCVIFETSERSWHGFTAVTPPPGRTLSRRSFAGYFYTTAAPPRRAADHSTIYVERPLGEGVRAGAPAGPLELEEARIALERRRQHLARLTERNREFVEQACRRAALLLDECAGELTEGAVEAARWLAAELDGQLEALYAAEQRFTGAFAADGRFDLTVRRRGALSELDGLWEDGWAGAQLSFTLTPPHDLQQLTVVGVVPAGLPAQELRLHVGAGRELARARFSPGRFEWKVPLEARAGDSLAARITAAGTFCPRDSGESGDTRSLAWLVESIG